MVKHTRFFHCVYEITYKLHGTRSVAIEKIVSFVLQHDNWKWCKCYLNYFFKNKFHFTFKKCHLLIRNEKR